MFVKDAKEEVVISLEQALAMMGSGEARRHIGRTDMNDASSRSHTIFRMVSWTSFFFSRFKTQLR